MNEMRRVEPTFRLHKIREWNGVAVDDEGPHTVQSHLHARLKLAIKSETCREVKGVVI